MLSDNLLKSLNTQVNYEFFSSYTYLAMAAYAESLDLGGCANFFRVQAQEELFHAMKFYDYINQKGGVVKLEAIDKPVTQYEDIVDVFKKGYEHEQTVTNRIYDLVNIATEEKEHATLGLLGWFVDEQVEEENTFNLLVKKIIRSANNPAALYMLDDELAARVFTPPATTP